MDKLPDEDFENVPENAQMLAKIDELLVSVDMRNLKLGIELIKGLEKLTVSHFNFCLAVYTLTKAGKFRSDLKEFLNLFSESDSFKRRYKRSKINESSHLYCKTHFSIWRNILAINFSTHEYFLDSDGNKELPIWINLEKYAVLPKVIKYVKKAQSISLVFNGKILFNDSYRHLSTIANLEHIAIICNTPSELPLTLLNLFDCSDLYLKNIILNTECKQKSYDKILNLNVECCIKRELGFCAFPNIENLTITEYLSNNIVFPKSYSSCLKKLKIKTKTNGVYSLPKEIFQLKKLEAIDIQGFNLCSIPQSIEELKSLKMAVFRECSLKQFPIHLAALPKLIDLSLSKNLIAIVPKMSSLSSKLAHLNLSHNRFTKFPNPLTAFQYLEGLNLANNQIKEVKVNISDFLNLEYLDLKNNHLTDLPNLLHRLPNLNKFFIRKNNIKKIPLHYFERFSKHGFFSIGNEIVSLPETPNNYKLVGEKNGRISIETKSLVILEYLEKYKTYFGQNLIISLSTE